MLGWHESGWCRHWDTLKERGTSLPDRTCASLAIRYANMQLQLYGLTGANLVLT